MPCNVKLHSFGLFYGPASLSFPLKTVPQLATPGPATSCPSHRMFLAWRCPLWTRAAVPIEAPVLQHHPLNCPFLPSIQNTQTTIAGEGCVPSYSHLIVTSSFHLLILITCSDWICLRNLTVSIQINICISVHKITLKVLLFMTYEPKTMLFQFGKHAECGKGEWPL